MQGTCKEVHVEFCRFSFYFTSLLNNHWVFSSENYLVLQDLKTYNSRFRTSKIMRKTKVTHFYYFYYFNELKVVCDETKEWRK